VNLERRERELQKELAQKEKMAAIGELLRPFPRHPQPSRQHQGIAQNTLLEIEQENRLNLHFKDIMLEATGSR